MTLKGKINDLLANNKPGEAIDKLLPIAEKEDKELHSALILLKSRFVSNENDKLGNLIDVSNYKIEKARISHALLQYLKDFKPFCDYIFPENTLSNVSKNGEKIEIMTDMNEKERKGYEEQLELLIEKKNMFDKEIITTYDTEKKFVLKKQLEELEKQIEELKRKLK